jgi:hypothetical protein
MSTIFSFLTWLKSKQAAFYMAVCVVLAVDGVLAWRASAIYYDVVWEYTKNMPLTIATSVVAFFAILLSSSIISIHPPESKKIFFFLAALAVVHDVGGIFFSVFQNTLYAHDMKEFLADLWEKPGSTILVGALSCLGLIPLTLSSTIEKWYNSMQAELEQQHANYLRETQRKIERVVIQKMNKALKNKSLEELVGIIKDERLQAFVQVVTGTVAPQIQAPQSPMEETLNDIPFFFGDDFFNNTTNISEDDITNLTDLSQFDENDLEEEVDDFLYEEEERTTDPLAVARRQK